MHNYHNKTTVKLCNRYGLQSVHTMCLQIKQDGCVKTNARNINIRQLTAIAISMLRMKS